MKTQKTPLDCNMWRAALSTCAALVLSLSAGCPSDDGDLNKQTRPADSAEARGAHDNARMARSELEQLGVARLVDAVELDGITVLPPWRTWSRYRFVGLDAQPDALPPTLFVKENTFRAIYRHLLDSDRPIVLTAGDVWGRAVPVKAVGVTIGLDRPASELSEELKSIARWVVLDYGIDNLEEHRFTATTSASTAGDWAVLRLDVLFREDDSDGNFTVVLVAERRVPESHLYVHIVYLADNIFVQTTTEKQHKILSDLLDMIRFN